MTKWIIVLVSDATQSPLWNKTFDSKHAALEFIGHRLYTDYSMTFGLESGIIKDNGQLHNFRLMQRDVQS